MVAAALLDHELAQMNCGSLDVWNKLNTVSKLSDARSSSGLTVTISCVC